MSKANALKLSAAMAAAALAALFLIVGLGLPAAQLKKGLAQTQEERPNIVFVLTDDLDSNSMKYLGGLRNITGQHGTTFEKAYVSNSLCCPSRATILRGQYPHNHGIRSNVPPTGGHDKFRNTGKDQSTVVTWLNDAGYQTKFIGKYMNGYDELYVPPGWDEWFGWLGEYKSQKVNDNGRVFQVQGRDTDLFTKKAVDFIRRASANPKPFFLSVWTRAPHQPAIPAPRYEDRFKDTPLPRPPSFNEKGVSDKPHFIQEKLRLTDGKIADMGRIHQKRLASMLSVEDLLGKLITALRETGEYGNTYIFFTSDNGYHLGQHRMTQGKRTAYEEDIRVPFMVRGPGVPPDRALEHLVLNNDFAPTFADLAGVTPPSFVDGTSLIPLLDANPPPVKNWRTGILTENWRTEAESGMSDAPNYKALRTKSFLLVRYANGERELYDMRQDPYQLHSRNLKEDRRAVQRLNNQLDRLVTCDGVECRAAETR
jgi:N-acetylglucosamine-6-sulfatase